MRILSPSLFHKFVEIRACGLRSTPDVVFWLKWQSVLGLKKLKIVISLKNTFTARSGLRGGGQRRKLPRTLRSRGAPVIIFICFK